MSVEVTAFVAGGEEHPDLGVDSMTPPSEIQTTGHANAEQSPDSLRTVVASSVGVVVEELARQLLANRTDDRVSSYGPLERALRRAVVMALNDQTAKSAESLVGSVWRILRLPTVAASGAGVGALGFHQPAALSGAAALATVSVGGWAWHHVKKSLRQPGRHRKRPGRAR